MTPRLTSRSVGWPWLLSVAVVSVLAAIPVRHDLRWIGDEGIWLRGAMQILGGNIPYRDFFEFHGPLGFYVVAGWLGVFGQTFTAARDLTATLAALTTIATYLLCLRVSKSPPVAAFLTVIWLLATQGDGAELTHHSITTLLSLGAMGFSLSERPLAAGLFSGAAGMTTQTRGLLCALAALCSVWRTIATVPRFALGLAAVPAAFSVYLVAEHTALDAWRDLVVWPLTSYSDIQGLPFGARANSRSIWAPLLYPLAISTAALFWRKWTNDQAYRTSLNFALAGLLGSFPRPDAIHLAWTLPVALPLAALVVTEVTHRLPRRWRFAGAAVALAFAISSAIPFGLLLIGPASRPTTRTLAGDIAFREPGAADMVRKVMALPHDDAVFFYPYMPMLPFVTRREQVGRYDIFLPYYTTKTQYAEAAADVAEHAQWLVYDRHYSDPRRMKEFYPKMPMALPPEYTAMEKLLRERFETVWSNARFEIRRARH